MLCVPAVAPAQDAPSPLLDPAKTYSVRYDTERQLVVWSASPGSSPLWTAPVHDYACHAVDAKGHVWVLEVAKVEDPVRSYDLVRLPSPVQPFKGTFEAGDWPGIEGAELLRDCLQRLGSLATGAGGQLISAEVLPGLDRPEFNTGPGQDVNFPRSLEDREAAATRLRNSCLEILNGQLATFSRTYCAYELVRGNSGEDRDAVFTNFRISAQGRNLLAPLAPIPVGARPAGEVTAWRSGKWLKLSSEQRQVINVLLVQDLLEAWAARAPAGSGFSAAKQSPNLGAVVLRNICRVELRYDETWSLLFGQDPWDGSAILSVISATQREERDRAPHRRRQAVVSLDAKLICPSILVACDGNPDAYRKWMAVMLAEAAVHNECVYRHDMLWFDIHRTPWIAVMGTAGKATDFNKLPDSLPPPWRALWRFLEQRQHYVFAGSIVIEEVKPLADPTALSRQALRDLKRKNLLEWFELPEGDVFALGGPEVLVFPQGGRPTVPRDGVVFPDRHPFEPLPSNDVYPPPPAGWQ